MEVRNSQAQVSGAKGFTLFELVIAIAIAGFVLTSIFKIADGSIRANSKMIDLQNENIEQDAFFSFLRNHFDHLPGNAVFDLINTSDTIPYTSELTFQDTPVAFNWGGVPIAAKATRLITVPTVTGGLDIVLEYYEDTILDSDEGLAEGGSDPIASVTLLSDVRKFEWSVLDVQNYESTERDDWPYVWHSPNLRPSYVELTVVFKNDGPTVKRLFWIPKKTNPQTVMRALQNRARGSRQNGGGATGTGGPATGGGGGGPGGAGGQTGGNPTR